MTKSIITPLESKYQTKPSYLTFEKHIKPELDKAGISKSTFERDRKAKPSSIPHERLQAYAALFDCDVTDLIESYSKIKIKPLVKTTIAKKSGLKTR